VRVRRSSLLLAAVVLMAAAAPARADGVSAFGMGALKAEWLAGYNGAEGLDPNGVFDLDLMSGANIKLYRPRFRQDQVLSNGAYTQWTMLDNLALHAANRDITLEPILINMPGEVYTPPIATDARNSFAAFAQAAARRYGPSGSFWVSCGCPAHPIKVWEVWNEENYHTFWNPASPSQYGAAFKAVALKLRKVDSTARLMIGGLAYPASVGAGDMEANTFLQQTISAVGRNGFDAVAVHLYDHDPEHGVNTLIKGTVDTLKTYAGTSNGAPRQQIWLNEFGLPTMFDDPSTPQDELAESEARQATWLDGVLDRLLPQRTAWNLGPVSWYAMRDYTQPTAAWLRLGLRLTNSDDTDAGPKPSWDDYAGRAASATQLPLPVAR
jgi:Glycosyl hydrolase catalytic core